MEIINEVFKVGITIIGVLIMFIVKGLFSRVSAVEKENRDIKENYIDRFAAVIKLINEANELGANRHAELKELIVSGKTQCAIHSLKIETLEQAVPKRTKRKAG
jgi:uncharacterized protein involved in exopolysaccharide biosynthesis